MKAVDFDYCRAASVDEACRHLASANGEAKIIAGGQTLVPLLAMRLARPALLVDINGVKELDGIVRRDGRVEIKACTRQADALASAVLRVDVPLLTKALRFVGHVQTRNRGTIGGSLANADPAAEIGLTAVTLGGEVMACGRNVTRRIPIEAFFVGAMTTALDADECLTALDLPIWPAHGRVGTGFQELSARRSDFAVVAAAAQVACDSDGICRRIAVGLAGVADAAIRIAAANRLVGTRLGALDVDAAVAALQDEIEPESDVHGSADYRRRVAAGLFARAVAEAAAEARAGRG